MKRTNIILTALFSVISVRWGTDPAQICHIELALHLDTCMAVKFVKSQHERGHDLLMTFSVKFHESSGWVAFGAGGVMDRALMFIFWPGDHQGDIVLSLRSTEHRSPHPLKNQNQVHAHSAEVDRNGFHVLRATCYSCEIIRLGSLNATSEQQPWLFASNYAQHTQTSDPNLRMDMHANYGLKWVNMAQAISTNQIYEYPTITADRSSIHVINPSGSNIPAVSTTVNMWNVHGMILSFSVILNFLGVLLIRSGFKSAFRGHWMVKALSALGMLVGCLIGVLKNTNVFQTRTLASTHKLVGLAIAVAVPVQIIFGYKHHVHYIKCGERTRSSLVHIYLGRALFIALKLNVFLGLLHGRRISTLRWLWAAFVLFEMLTVSMMIIAKRKNAAKGYGHVEGDEFDPFVIEDDEEKLTDPEEFGPGPSNPS